MTGSNQTIYLTVKNANGCTATTNETVASYALPTAAFSDIPTGVCEGESYMVTAAPGQGSYCFSTSGTCTPTGQHLVTYHDRQ